MRKISTGWWVVIILYAISLIATVITHSMLFSRYSYDNIAVACIDKRIEQVNFYSRSYERVCFDFTADNNGVCDANAIKGELKIVDRVSQSILVEGEYNLNSIYARDTYEFYISFYDKSVDYAGIENFDTIYSKDFSDLEVSFEITAADFTESDFLFGFVKTVAPIPSYLVAVLLAGIIMILGPVCIYALGEKIGNAFLKSLYIIILLPLWIFGYAMAHASTKKEKKGIWIFIPD